MGASYASAARYPMDNHNVIDIGLHVIKQCGMYSKEYKNWIVHENETPPIVETIDSFKEYWADTVTLVNQTAAPAWQHGYDMAAMDNDASIASYIESLANFGAAYAATQESMKAQATTMTAMQGQLTNIQQFCMAVAQQPPANIYIPSQQQPTFNNCRNRRNSGGHDNSGTDGNSGGGGGNFPQQPTWFGGNGTGTQQPTHPPTPYKHWENWNCCHTHGGDVDDTHMGIGAQHTMQMRLAQTSWADLSPECTRPSFPQGAAILLSPPVAPSSSSIHSSTHQWHTTLSRA